MVGGSFDFRVTPNPNFMLDVNLDVEFDNKSLLSFTHLVYNLIYTFIELHVWNLKLDLKKYDLCSRSRFLLYLKMLQHSLSILLFLILFETGDHISLF